MGRFAGPLLGVGLLVLVIQPLASTCVFLVWRHDVNRARR